MDNCWIYQQEKQRQLSEFDSFARILSFSMSTKRTYQPKKRRYARVHGFLKRMQTREGREVLSRRRAKGRHRIAVKTNNTRRK